MQHFFNTATRASRFPKGFIQSGLIAHYGAAIKNLVPWSTSIQNWDIYHIAKVIPFATTAPDGTRTACKITEEAIEGEHLVYYYLATSTGTVTFSIYAKAAERSYLFLYGVNDTDGDVSPSLFNLTTGTVEAGSHASAKIEAANNGFYRCSITATPSEATNWAACIATNSGAWYTGDGASGIYLWGGQIEKGDRATSLEYSFDRQTLFNQKLTPVTFNNLIEDPIPTTSIKWGGYQANISNVTAGVVRATCTGGDYYGTTVGSAAPAVVAGHEYYVRVEARVLNGSADSISAYLYDETNNNYVAEWETPAQNNWYVLEGLCLAASSGDGVISIIQQYADASTANGKEMEVRNPVIIDLTATFGDYAIKTTEEMRRWALENHITTWVGSLNTLYRKYNGRLGSGGGADSAAPAWCHGGLLYAADDYVWAGDLGKNIRAIQVSFWLPFDMDYTGDGCLVTLDTSETDDEKIHLGGFTSAFADELVSVGQISTNARSSWCSTTEVIKAGWHVLTANFTGAIWDLYLDGRRVPITTAGTPSPMGSGDVYLGVTGTPLWGYFDGVIRDVLLYERTLTEPERLHNERIAYLDIRGREVL